MCSMIPVVSMMIILLLVNPIFERKNKKFIEKCQRKLRASCVVTIGITGSFGKTGCKNILAAMLRERYAVVATEKNYNTPMGVAMTIDKMSGDEDYLIAEMGARKKGDVAELCDLVRPEYAIVTGVCPQHLATFRSLHNIYEEKNELPKRTAGFTVFNAVDVYAAKMYRESKKEKILCCLTEKGDVFADNIVLSPTGTTFELHFKEQGETISVETKLLGRHNVINVCLCAALARKLGVTAEEISRAVRNLTPVPHRLEYSYKNGIHILDDGYNGNERGVSYAMEVLDAFEGRKIIVSQGIAEGGRKRKELNRKIGERIASHADVIVLCGPNRKDLLIGLKEGKFDGKVYVEKNLLSAQKKFRKWIGPGDVVLLQNDMPDVL